LSPKLIFKRTEDAGGGPESLKLLLEIDPLDYFYVWLDRREGEGKKREALFSGKKYKSAFENVLGKSFKSYLRAVENETEIECSKRLMESVRFQTTFRGETVYDVKTVYDLVRRLGPRALRLPSILGALENWCEDGKFDNFKGLIKAIRRYQREMLKGVKYKNWERLYSICVHYRAVRDSIFRLKKEIKKAQRANDKDPANVSERILRAWGKGISPLVDTVEYRKLLQQIAISDGSGEGARGIIICVPSYSPRELAIELLAQKYHVKWAVADRAIRRHKEIEKIVYV